MGPDGVVVAPPLFNQDLRLTTREDDLAAQEIVASARVERLAVAVLPGRARFNEGGLRADGRDSGPRRPAHEFAAGVGTDVFRQSSEDAEIQERVDHVRGVERAFDADHHRLLGVFVTRQCARTNGASMARC